MLAQNIISSLHYANFFSSNQIILSILTCLFFLPNSLMYKYPIELYLQPINYLSFRVLISILQLFFMTQPKIKWLEIY